MRSVSTRIPRALKVSGKACVQRVMSLWFACAQAVGVLHSSFRTTNELWITNRFTHSVYTNCMQVLRNLVGKFTSVISMFYTVCTGPITTTTTYINRRIV